MTKHVDWLQERGWLERVAHPTDRRMIYARITLEGAARLRGMFPDLYKMARNVWEDIPDEDQKHLLRILSALRLSIDSRYPSRSLDEYEASDKALIEDEREIPVRAAT